MWDSKLVVVSRETLTEGIGLHTWLGAFVTALAERFREADERLRLHLREGGGEGEGEGGGGGAGDD